MATLAYMYPVDAQSRLERFTAKKATFKTIWDKAKESGTLKGVMIDMVDAYYSDTKGTVGDPAEEDER